MSLSTRSSELESSHTVSSAGAIQLTADDWQRLTYVDARGNRHVNVRVVPLFPLTDPERWISICDRSGRELVSIVDLDELAPESRQVLRQVLSRREFLPVIRRIAYISSYSEPCDWHVETDRGPTSFVLTSEDHVRRLGANQVSVTDSNGVRYLIDDVAGLDRKSRRVVDWYV
ncbi:MAG: DUF1854 domain-containing protein [Pirellulales bacterium]